MAQHEYARWLGAAAGNAEQQAHLEPRNFFLVQDFDVKSRLAADGRATFGPFVAGSSTEIAEFYRRFRAGGFTSMSELARSQRLGGLGAVDQHA